MKKCIGIFFIAISILTACKDKKQDAAKDTPVNDPTNTTTVTTAADPAKDSADIRTVITSFYNWYNKNYKSLMGYQLYSGIKKKDMPPYKINWDEVTKYQDYIRTSIPQLGEEFLKNQKLMLQQADSAFKVDKEDEVPYGFDYDWYTNSQEDAQYTVDEMNKAKQWIIKVNGDNATAEVKGSYNDGAKEVESTVIKAALKKENGQWKISRIGGE